MVNLWEAALHADLEDSTDDVVPLMNLQCQELKEATGGRVHGRFIELRRTSSEAAIVGVLKSFAKGVGGINTTEEDELPQRDISSDYDKKPYGFDVYSDDYAFRPFEISLGPVYPITLSVDEVIWRESREQFLECLATGERNASDGVVNLYDGDQLMGCFKVIVNSRKMRFILRKMMSGGVASGEEE